MEECKECGSVEHVIDNKNGDVICTNCGVCCSPVIFDTFYEFSRDSVRYSIEANPLSTPEDLHKKRQSAPYRRLYHANEIIAQWCCTGPSIDGPKGTHPGFMEKILDFSCSPDAKDIGDWDHRYIKSLCKRFGERGLGERWAQIKRKVCFENIRESRPPKWLVSNLRRNIERLSDAFDRTLYKPGKRRTRKDEARYWGSPHPLARHNFIHSGFLFQRLLHWEGMLSEVNGCFYFPGIKTKSVARKTQAMFSVLMKECSWSDDYGPYTLTLHSSLCMPLLLDPAEQSEVKEELLIEGKTRDAKVVEGEELIAPAN